MSVLSHNPSDSSALHLASKSSKLLIVENNANTNYVMIFLVLLLGKHSLLVVNMLDRLACVAYHHHHVASEGCHVVAPPPCPQSTSCLHTCVRCAVRRSVEWYVYVELKSHVCWCVVVKYIVNTDKTSVWYIQSLVSSVRCLSCNIRFRDVVTAQARPIRRVRSGRHWPSGDCKMPRLTKLSTDSTVLPSTKICCGLGLEPMFCGFVFGQAMLSPRCEAESLKLLSNVIASMADGRSKAVSST